MLQIRMANSARWLKQDNRRKGTKLQPAHPPPWAVNGIHCMSVWPGLRLLEGIVEAPTLRPDGTIIEQPGYDPATQYVLIPSGSFPPVPRNPGFSHAEAASRRLLDVIRQFEIQTPVHRSVWLAGLLSVVGRPAIEGYVPLFWFDGNRSSVGKTLLVDVISMIATGRCASRSTYPSGAHVNEEMRKMITALALEGTRITLLDNVTGILGCASLDNAITGSVRSDRLLGLSETTGDLSVRMVWFATCNHGKLGADLPTRSLLCRLATTYEYPEDRSDFDHPDLLGYVQANRAGLLIDALTILHAYVLAGRPSPVKPWVRFASWSDLIASAVYWVTGCNPRDVCEDIKAEDQAHEVERDLLVQLSFLLSMKPLTAAEVLTRARQTSRQGGLHTEALDHPDLWNALHALGGENVDSDWLPSPKRLGDELKKIEGRPIGGWKVVSNFDVHTKIKLWKLVRVAPVPV
jgi:hypothetical protein